MANKRKKPTFGSRDQAEIKKKQDKGGLSDETKARRLGAMNVFDKAQEICDRPTLKALCEARDKDGLESDLQGFFQSYYVQMPDKELVDIDKNDIESHEDENDNIDSDDEGSVDIGDDENVDLEDLPDDQKSDGGDEDKDDGNLDSDEMEDQLRPKQNTALGYKSHFKQLIKGFTSNQFDISDKTQFPNFDVSR